MALTCRIGAGGSRRIGGTMVTMFFWLMGLCERVHALREEERGEMRSIRPLVSGPATDNLNVPTHHLPTLISRVLVGKNKKHCRTFSTCRILLERYQKSPSELAKLICLALSPNRASGRWRCFYPSTNIRHFADQNQVGPPNTLMKGCPILVPKSLGCHWALRSFWTT